MSKSSSPWPVFILLTLLTVFTAGLNVSMTQPTSGSRPSPATLQSLDFDLNAKTAVATVAIDGESGSHRVDLSTATFDELVDWANHPKCTLSLLQDVGGEWHVQSTSQSYATSLLSFFVISMATLLMGTRPNDKRLLLRLAFPSLLLLLFWGIHLYYGIFLWSFLIHLIPLAIGGIVFYRRNRPRSAPPPTRPTLSWSGALVLLIIAFIFGGAGLTLKGFLFHKVNATYTSLQAREAVTLTPHLVKQTHGTARRGRTRPTRHIIASYETAKGVRHYVHLTSEDPLFTAEHRSQHFAHFNRLYRGHTVRGSVALHDPNDVLPNLPPPDAFLLLHETWRNRHGIYAIHLLAIPFLLVGLNLFMLVLIECLPLRGRIAYASASKQWMPQVWLMAAQWSLVPLALLAASQWFALYSRLPNLPLISTCAALLPIAITLIIIALRKAQCKRCGIYRLDYQKTDTALRFSLTPPQGVPPTVKIGDQTFTPTASADNTWTLAWASPPKHLEIQLQNKVYFEV